MDSVNLVPMAKILIIEDDSLLLNLYAQKFKKEGFDVETALDGESGLAKTKGYLPNLVLLDILIPKINGFTFLEKMKADPKIKEIPVILLTNLAQEENVNRGLALGAVAYLIKSKIHPDDVVAKVNQILDVTGKGSKLANNK